MRKPLQGQTANSGPRQAPAGAQATEERQTRLSDSIPRASTWPGKGRLLVSRVAVGGCLVTMQTEARGGGWSSPARVMVWMGPSACTHTEAHILHIQAHAHTYHAHTYSHTGSHIHSYTESHMHTRTLAHTLMPRHTLAHIQEHAEAHTGTHAVDR